MSSTTTLERVHVWLNRADLDLLRAEYRGTKDGYGCHIRAAVADLCRQIRREMREDPERLSLLRRIGQERL